MERAREQGVLHEEVTQVAVFNSIYKSVESVFKPSRQSACLSIYVLPADYFLRALSSKSSPLFHNYNPVKCLH